MLMKFKKKTALHLACENGQFQIVQYFISNGAKDKYQNDQLLITQNPIFIWHVKRKVLIF